MWSESDEHYHRRLNRMLNATLNDAAAERIDHYVLRRMYDYTGHLVRVFNERMHGTVSPSPKEQTGPSDLDDLLLLS